MTKNASAGRKTATVNDRAIGLQMSKRRRKLRLTQDDLGQRLNLTFQQVQKYEKGVNRISAGRLYEIASILKVKIEYFYETLPQPGSCDDMGEDTFPRITAETLELAAAFQSIRSREIRRAFIKLAQGTAAATGEHSQG